MPYNPISPAKRREAHLRAITRNKAYILGYKMMHPCVDCGEADPIVLVFDHIDRKTKKAQVSNLHCSALNVVMKEIEKCEVRCANCHHRKTHNNKEWSRSLS